MRYDSVARLVIYVQNNRDIKYVPRLVLECRRQRKNLKRKGAGNASCTLAYIPNSNRTPGLYILKSSQPWVCSRYQCHYHD